MTAATRLFALLALVAPFGVTGCSGINLEMSTHREFPKADRAITAPPADLIKGNAE